MILFSTKKYQYLKEEFLKDSFFSEGKLEETFFSDGEKYTRILSKCKGEHATIIGGTINDEDIMDIFDLSTGLVQLGIKSLTIVIPFFGYSTMERAELDGEIVKAKSRAKLLSIIPNAYQGNNIILVDLHKDGIVHYFENNVHAQNMNTNDLIVEVIQNLKLENFAIGSTDEGGLKRVRKIANKLDVQPLVVLKRRSKSGTKLETSMDVDSDIKHIVLVDDMIRSGKSILQAVNAYSKDKPIEFTLIATHGVFCEGGYDLLKSDPRIKNIIVSNSHPESKGKEIFDITGKIINLIKEGGLNE